MNTFFVIYTSLSKVVPFIPCFTVCYLLFLNGACRFREMLSIIFFYIQVTSRMLDGRMICPINGRMIFPIMHWHCEKSALTLGFSYMLLTSCVTGLGSSIVFSCRSVEFHALCLLLSNFLRLVTYRKDWTLLH